MPHRKPVLEGGEDGSRGERGWHNGLESVCLRVSIAGMKLHDKNAEEKEASGVYASIL